MNKIAILKLLIMKMTLLVALLQQQPPHKLGGVGAATPLTDYKYAYINWDTTNWTVKEAGVRFYEGGVTTEIENTIENGVKADRQVTRYRRSKKLDHTQLPATKHPKPDSQGGEVMVYTTNDFGLIRSRQELDLWMKMELAKDKTRQPIPEEQ